MFELPDDVLATGMAARVASSGAFASPTCTRMMTGQETLAALCGAGGRHGIHRAGATWVGISSEVGAWLRKCICQLGLNP
jgi:hypothetical protein